MILDRILGRGARAAPRVEPTFAAVVQDEQVPSSDRVRMGEIFGYQATAAGAVVNEQTAMRVSAVYACVSLIAGTIAQLPIEVYERIDGWSKPLPDHPYWWILNEQPAPIWGGTPYWEFMVAQMLLRGGGISYLVRNRAGAITAILPWPRSQVQWKVIRGESPREPARLRYYFQAEDGYFGADQDDVLHFPGFGFNPTTYDALSVIQWGARNGIGIAMKGDEFAGKFFGQGAQPQFAVTAAGEMTPSQQDDFRDAWVKKYSGAGINGIPLILTEGLDIKELSMSATDAQLLESRQWQVVDVARAFGVPPQLIGETEKASTWGAGVEQIVLAYSKFTISPHIGRIHDELNRKIFRTARNFCEHSRDALLEGDSKAQSELYAKALGGPGSQGYMSVNEVRRRRRLPPANNPKFNEPVEAGKGKPEKDKTDENA